MESSHELAVECGGCGTESRHSAYVVLTRTASCPGCGIQLVEEGRALARHFDEANSFAMWAEVLMAVEDRLGIATPGIPDGEMLGTKPLAELTLRDLVRTVEAHVPAGSEATGLVLESAAQVAERAVSASDLDCPLLQALGIPHWADKPAEPGAAPDRAGE